MFVKEFAVQICLAEQNVPLFHGFVVVQFLMTDTMFVQNWS